MELVGVFSRRDPASLVTLFESTKVYSLDDLQSMKDMVDVLVLCAGSATDLPLLTPRLALDFTLVDSFDTHAKIPEHFQAVDTAARLGGNLAIISLGWDPGLFSLNRAIAQAVLPNGCDYTFWGRGVSQGHSDAVRRLAGVKDARQYTVPIEAALDAVRAGETPDLTVREKHRRLVYVVAEAEADQRQIEQAVLSLPDYFADYDTTVVFITAQEMAAEHSALPHGGKVFRIGRTGLHAENNHILEYSLRLDSNPEFTASVLVAYARAAVRLAKEGNVGCKTIFDIAPSYLSPMAPEELRAKVL
jgi:diaminopimelate dehydrogenase